MRSVSFLSTWTVNLHADKAPQNGMVDYCGSSQIYKQMFVLMCSPSHNRVTYCNDLFLLCGQLAAWSNSKINLFPIIYECFFVLFVGTVTIRLFLLLYVQWATL